MQAWRPGSDVVSLALCWRCYGSCGAGLASAVCLASRWLITSLAKCLFIRPYLPVFICPSLFVRRFRSACSASACSASVCSDRVSSESFFSESVFSERVSSESAGALVRHIRYFFKASPKPLQSLFKFSPLPLQTLLKHVSRAHEPCFWPLW